MPWAPLARRHRTEHSFHYFFLPLSPPSADGADAILLIKISPLTTTRGGGGWIARGENGFGAYRVRQYIVRWVHV